MGTIRHHLLSKKTIYLWSFLLTLVLALATAAGLHYRDENVEPKLPPVAQHADIPSQTLTTYAESLAITSPADLSTYKDSKCAPLAKDWVAQENQQPGAPYTTKFWQNLDIANPTGSVLYLDKTSVSCGDKVTIRASSYNTWLPDYEKGPRTFEALRIGWYQGSGAKVVWSAASFNLKRQRIPFATSATRMIETSWKPSALFEVGKDWKPGLYLIISISPSGRLEGSAPLIVRSPLGSSPLVLVHSTLTWSAYNTFGGRSLYFGPGATAIARRAERSRVSSMDRPIVGSGAEHIHRDAISLVQFMEKQGLSVDQIADTDLDQWPSIAKSYNGIVYSGHAEYWTRRQLEATIAARNAGVNVAILGGNTAYWQTRIQASPLGSYRRVIEYRSATEDPVIDPSQVTLQFSDKRVNSPGWMLTAGEKSGVHVYGSISAVDVPTWLNIPANTVLRGWASESEIERRSATPSEPTNVHVLLSGTMTLRDPKTATAAIPLHPTQESVWYTTPSGAAVFNAGISMWSCDLMPTCAISTVDSATRDSLQNITGQILTLWGQKEIGKVLK